MPCPPEAKCMFPCDPASNCPRYNLDTVFGWQIPDTEFLARSCPTYSLHFSAPRDRVALDWVFGLSARSLKNTAAICASAPGKVSERLCRSGSLCSRIRAEDKRCRRNPSIAFWRGLFHSRINSRVNHADHHRSSLSRQIRSPKRSRRSLVLPFSPRQHTAPIHSSSRRSIQS